MARLSIRIDLEGGGQIGPGKIRLLETVAETGSISAAGRALGMSYRRAWLLVSQLNSTFDQPVVDANVGGKQGGGATLTVFGQTVVRSYRDIQAICEAGAQSRLQSLEDAAQRVLSAGSPPAS